jgi:hypothetical protein
MKALDLTKTLKKYKSGWVAIDETKQKVVAHAKDFASINQKIQNKKELFIMPASQEYYGFITKLSE